MDFGIGGIVKGVKVSKKVTQRKKRKKRGKTSILTKRKPNKQHYVRVDTISSSQHHRPYNYAMDKAREIENSGYQPKVWWNSKQKRWEIFRSRRKK